MPLNLTDTEFGPLTWGAYLKLKLVVQKTLGGRLIRVVLDFLSSEAGQALIATFQGDSTPEQLKDHWPAVKAFFEQNVQTVLEELLTTSDEVAQILMEGCVRGDLKLDSLTAREALELRTEVLKHADFAELVALEKNWWLGLASQAGKMFGTNPSSNLDPASIGTLS